MATKSKIEWTESTWNPVTGCTKISPGCANCYAERLAKRLHLMGQPNYKDGFQVKTHEHVLDMPLSLKKSQMIFVNSMSDLFHEEIDDQFILEVFRIMEKAYWHKFQILTKRAERLARLSSSLPCRENIWIGVSVENEDYKYRIDLLKKSYVYLKFISFEPLIGSVGKLDLNGIDWVIVGGESGPGARYISQEWVTDIRDQCLKQKVPFFFKQWGGTNKKKAGRLLEGKIWDEIPLELKEKEAYYGNSKEKSIY